MATVEQVKTKMLDAMMAVDFGEIPIADIGKYAQVLQTISTVSNTPYWEGIYQGFCKNSGGESYDQ